ncbi:MAG TPA: DUF1501 domain-containing protein [Hyphomonadaceae bacterium]|nr:DUF1501 domain-containing protein [Hyphomonadaceae bacterium]HPN04608.1 DUF1501 domain-containing protein [Hyphomonadaceae bacterium]
MSSPSDFDSNDRAHGSATRRQALKTLGLATAVGVPMLTPTVATGAAAAQTADDYKALVCITLIGGNDQSNTVIPRSGGAYSSYQAARPTLAIPSANILPISPTGFSGPELGLSPSLPGLRTLFEQGRCAVVANVGTLAEPMTRDQWKAGSKRAPRQLFSHSDQYTIWESGLADRVSESGWLGRLGDMTANAFNPSSQLSITMSIAGTTQILAGNQTIQYQVSSGGVARVRDVNSLYGSAAGGAAFKQLFTMAGPNVLQDGLSSITTRALSNAALVETALAAQPALTSVFPNTDIGNQAKMVARMIGARKALQQRRQIFVIAMGGWDMHNSLTEEHLPRLKDLDAAMSALYAATAEMGVSSNVTQFTVSEFGRCLQHNGRGSDHGWGSHHFVVGGAVQGRRVFGNWPTVALNTAEDAGNGALVPTTSLDEYAATLARWFGASPTQLGTVMPNLSRFANPNLGFLA